MSSDCASSWVEDSTVNPSQNRERGLACIGTAVDWLIFGSSRFTGKCCFYLQKEVVVIPVAVGHPLDHLDLVVHSLQHTGVQPVDRAGDNAVDVALEAPGKLLHGGQPTTHS